MYLVTDPTLSDYFTFFVHLQCHFGPELFMAIRSHTFKIPLSKANTHSHPGHHCTERDNGVRGGGLDILLERVVVLGPAVQVLQGLAQLCVGASYMP